jgi:ketosteroid isomerase-like protein
MKTIRTILVLLSVAVFAAAADPVEDVERAWAKAVAAKDYGALDGMLADTLIYAHSTGNVETKNQYLDQMKAGTQKYDSIVHEKLTVAPYGDAAVAHSVVRMKGTNNQGPFDNRLMMMHVWAKSGGKWRLVAHQTTRLTN